MTPISHDKLLGADWLHQGRRCEPIRALSRYQVAEHTHVVILDDEANRRYSRLMTDGWKKRQQ